MRTFSREHFEEARRSWEGFGWKWQHIRRVAAERGFIYAPTGTAHDDRDAESPSQRAIVWRVLEDNPAELERIVRHSASWSQVIDQIIGLEDRMRADVYDSERDDAWERRTETGPRQAVQSIAHILRRIRDSA